MENISICLEEPKVFKCKVCEKHFNHHSSLYRHQKTCVTTQKKDEPVVIENNNIVLSSPTIDYEAKFNQLYDMIMNQKQEIESLKTIVNEQNIKIEKQNEVIINLQSNVVQTSIVTPISISKPPVSPKQKETLFNLDKYLNEDCNDALNIKDWVAQHYDPCEMDFAKYIDNNSRTATGIAAVKYLNKTKQTSRPIQLTDARRNHFKVKHNDMWLDSETDECKKLMKSIASCFTDKTIKCFTPWWKEIRENAKSSNDDRESKRLGLKCDKIMVNLYDVFYNDEKLLNLFISQIIQSCKIEK
jgi:hypothetical protein